jgi:hypothetical protein
VADASKRFMELTFDGGRFVAHSVPVDVLAELATVQRLLVKVARHLFFLRHTDRQRVPQGFVDAAQIHLASAEANCFTAELERPGAWEGASPDDLAIFASARDLSIEALAAASRGDPLPPKFPGNALDLLAALGRRLENGESLLVRGIGAAAPSARVDHESRAKLAAFIQQPLERVERIDGEVEQMDDASHRFTLRTRAGQRIEVPFEQMQRAPLLDAFGQRPIARVRVRGQLLLGTPWRMRQVEELEVVDDERATEVQKVWDRLASFTEIADGWFQGEGRAPSERAIVCARQVLARVLVERREIERPLVFPTPGGGVQAEWVIGSWAADVSFDPESGAIEAEATNGETHEERSASFSVDKVSADAVTPLAEWLESLATSSASSS